MPSLKPCVRTAVWGLVALSCGSLFGQAPAAVPPHLAQTDQQFAEIQRALTQTADSILESATARTRELPDPTIARSGFTPLEPKIKTKEQSERRNGRLDSLQSLIWPILLRQGVPSNLAAVMVVESGGNPLALSPKGARGLWQLMPDTARRYGLTVNPERDDRLDPEKSTVSAARYLRDLYLQFGSWPLALAAYNTGEENVQRAIARSHSREFQLLSLLRYLPAETRHYVPAVLAAMNSESTFSESQSTRGAELVFAVMGQ